MTIILATNTAPTSPLPDVYFEPISTQQNVAPANSGIGAIIGEFSRGPVDQPTWVGQLNDLVAQFGGPTDSAASPGTPLSGYFAAANMAQQGVLDKYIVRVGTAAMAQAKVVLSDSNPTPVVNILAATPGTWANSNLQVVIAVGTQTSPAATWKVTAANLATNEALFVMDNLSFAAGAAGMLASVNAINGAHSALITASMPLIANATTAPTGVATTGGGLLLGAGTYLAVYTWYNSYGETLQSTESAPVTLASPGKIVWTIPATPTGATGGKLYMTLAGGSTGTETFCKLGVAAATTIQIDTAFTVAGAALPSANTAINTAGSTTPVTGTFTIPATSTGAYTVGNDGAGSSSLRHVGVVGTPNTGAYTLTSVSPKPNFVVQAEAAGTDTTTWLTQATVAQTNNWQAVVSLARGTAPSAVPALMATSAAALAGLGDYLKVGYNWVQVQDNILYKALVWCAPASFLAGVTAVQLYNTAAYNKPLVGIYGLENNMTPAQRTTVLNAFANAVVYGIPANAGAYGFDGDYQISGSNAFEVRARQFFASQVDTLGGPFVGFPNSPGNRILFKTLVTDLFLGEANAGHIPANPPTGVTPTVLPPGGSTTPGVQPSTVQTANVAAVTTQGYSIVCDSSNNVVNGVTLSDLTMDIQAQLFANAKRVLIRAQIGVTVVVTVSTATAAA